jgi:2,3-bisphosphoglycerate-independent phosphoglycerate mutase
MSAPRPKPLILLVLDGWGVAPAGDGNPIAGAKLPYLDEIIRTFPTVAVRASGEAVGLSWGEMGNSEVGHLTIGAGTIFYQSFPRINLAIQSGEFFRNEEFLAAAEHCRKKGTAFHIMGICSPGNVHGSDAHIHALLEFAKQQELTEVYVHAFMDGRDTTFNAGVDFITALQAKMDELGIGKIASLSGRFYAMDRDNRWERVQVAYNAIVGRAGERTAEDPVAVIRESYAKEVYDEEFKPTTIVKGGVPVGPVKDGDALVFANFRPDRARELAQAFSIPGFQKFEHVPMPNLFFVTMTEYEKGTPAKVAFPPNVIEVCLARVLSEQGLTQLHIAETEKYAHVSFFLNGMREEEFKGETRVIIPSPRVSSYDQAPEMSTIKITDRILKEVQAGTYDVILANFANADMVGHTGSYEATRKAVETVDACIGRIVTAVLPLGGVVMITADHGNGEEVLNLQTGAIDKEHSTNPVPFIVVGEQWRGQASPSGEVIGGDLSLMPPVGMLADVAPTVLKVLNVPQPDAMTGSPLI